MNALVRGDYVLATKYSDGDPCDHFVVGFYAGLTRSDPPYNPPRHDVVDGDGRQFRGNGFRRCERISDRVGAALVAAMPVIGDKHGRSVWYWRYHPAQLDALREANVKHEGQA